MPNLVGLYIPSLQSLAVVSSILPYLHTLSMQSKTGWWLVNEARITNWNATVAYGATNYIFMHSCGPKIVTMLAKMAARVHSTYLQKPI